MSKSRIDIRILEENKTAFAQYCKESGQTITENLLQYINSCTHNKSVVHTKRVESVHTSKSSKDIVPTIPDKPKETVKQPEKSKWNLKQPVKGLSMKEQINRQRSRNSA